jgi:DNA-binding transcriptional LysR family regulator
VKKPNLNRLEYFVAIAEAGSITAAAERMRISKAVVSKQLQLLEQELGATLIIRNSRHLKLTETGQSFFEAARASVAQAEEAYAMVRHGRAEPSGTLSITAPLDLGVTFISPMVAEFQATYPSVTINLTLSDMRMDPVESRFDVAFRVGWLSDSSNIARKLADFQQFAVASPVLIEKYGVPSHPTDLAAFPFIEHRALPKPSSWSFSSPSGETERVTMNTALSADETAVIRALAVHSAGISILPDFFVRQELSSNALTQLLPDWHLRSGGIYAVYPPTQFRSAATQKFTNFLTKNLRATMK